MPADESKPAARPRSGNRRDEAARLAVLHAADDLVAEQGFGAVSVEGIARRAGVAKQTIYRWWPSKVAILLDTLVEDAEKQIPVPVEAADAEAIRQYLRRFTRFLTRDPAGTVLLALIGEAQQDASTAQALRERFLTPRHREEGAMLEAAGAAGAVAPTLSADAAADALTGPILARALAGRSIPRGFVDALVDDLLKPS